MREWSLKPGDPLILNLAADARLGGVDYSNDQIWELQLGGGEPPAVAIQTTYGLRARSQRLFARFSEGDHTASEPAGFKSQPVVKRFYPNYLKLHYSPLQDIDVEAEYWVPASQTLAGRLSLHNAGRYPRQIRLGWVALLAFNDGQRMAPAEMDGVQVLAGQTEQIFPLVYLSPVSSVVSSPLPALIHTMELGVGETARLVWCHAAGASLEESFGLARDVAARNWDAEIARLELLNASQVEVLTGNADWDTAFAVSQKLAGNLLHGPGAGLPESSFVLTRHPDQGFSRRGDGGDYNYLWNGQPPLEALYLAGLVLPGGANLVQGWVRNFLAAQAGDGGVDWKPGMAGQRALLQATPVLAALAWRAFQVSGDLDFLGDVFPRLVDFIESWFTPRHDRNGDGIPEWDHPTQAGYEDHPRFSRWHENSLGLDISMAGSPGLCALLYRECRALVQMGARLGREERLPSLLAHADALRNALESAWDPAAASYLYWDRDTGRSTPGELLGERTGQGELVIHREFELPVRPQIILKNVGDASRKPRIVIYGENITGQSRVEHITDERIRWNMGRGVITGERVYRRIERVEIQGIHITDLVQVHSADFSSPDISTLLPLWASVPDPERAEQLVQTTLMNPEKYLGDYGLRMCVRHACADNESSSSVQMPWNTLVGLGLLQYGYVDEAAGLVTRLMNAVIRNLKDGGAVYHRYDADHGAGAGERNILNGLAPLELFLETLGVRPLTPFRVFVSGFNPFPWAVTVKYRGMTLLRRKDKTIITFPDGQSVTVKGPAPQIVSHDLSG